MLSQTRLPLICLLGLGLTLLACPDEAAPPGVAASAHIDGAGLGDGILNGNLDLPFSAPDDTAQAPELPTPALDISAQEGDAPAPSDTGGPCGGLSCACTSNGDCDSGYCVEGPDGLMCTELCVQECSVAGHDCVLTTALGPDPISVCVPRHVRLCRPCKTNDDCKAQLDTAVALCVPALDPNDGSFCGANCQGGLPCPDGYACVPVATPSGAQVKQCLPTSGQCTCRASWAGLGYETDCQNVSPTGTCAGTRTCGPLGLSSCEGPLAAPEVCNGLDDDCNGQIDDIAEAPCEITNAFGTCQGQSACDASGAAICLGDAPAAEVCNGADDNCDGAVDEGTCDDGLGCTQNLCSADLGCSNPLDAGTCLIAGTCYVVGQANPADPCEQCLPEISQTTWSDADGQPCNDGEVCTHSDVCTGGTCGGIAYTCNDGLSCTQALCDGEGGCDQVLAAGFCLIDNGCVAAGTLKADGGCLICAPDAFPKGWSVNDGGGCNDGDPCTQADLCAGATCAGTVYSCDDDNLCTVDACDGQGGCTHTPVVDACIIDSQCIPADMAKPGEPCLACRPAISTTTWTPVEPGAACDDGLGCTQGDVCLAGLCAGNSYSCDDARACTTDTCLGDGTCKHTPMPGTCFIDDVCFADAEPSPQDVCLRCDSQSSATSWSPNDGAACDDGAACTAPDLCAGGTCSGSPYTCDDGLWCTTDLCTGDGGCDAVVDGGCLIEGACAAVGTKQPTNPCYACDPAISLTTWSPSTGAACNDKNACTHDDVCQAGACVGAAYSCSDSACFVATCDGLGGCDESLKPGKCHIDGNCYDQAEPNPQNGCLACDPTTDTAAWTNAPDATCTDNKTCTQDDHCVDGACVGSSYGCDDQLWCTLDTCTGDGGCTHPVSGGCLIAGQCVAIGTAQPGNPCFACDPTVSTTTWSPASGAVCNDGNACTHTDTCQSGTCSGTSYSCGDTDCFTATCDGTGGCDETLKSGKCFIGQICYANGASNPQNGCLRCDVAASTSIWTNDSAATCSDANPCTKADHCVGGACTGTSYVCDDGLWCTADACTGNGGCSASVAGGCLIGGQCYSVGTGQPNNPCFECNPELSLTTWSPASGAACNDGNTCTHTDTCQSGTCTGTSYACSDSACFVRTCDGGGGCDETLKPQKCAIGGKCYSNGDANPQNGCQWCNSASNTSNWSNHNNIACTDGQLCTSDDHCIGGSCVGSSYTCNDGKWCTTNTCNGSGGCTSAVSGGCLVGGTCYSSGASQPNNPCFECNPSLSLTSWSPASGKSCNDNNPCTHSDTCQSGTCAGVSYSCAGSACFSATCDGAGGCTEVLKANKCFIANTCYSNGQTKPNNVCYRCSSASSTSSFSLNNGASCNDANACTTGDTCSGGTCAGAAILDIYDQSSSNNTRTSATNLGNITDKSNYPKGTFTATLYGPGDEDWYRYHDQDKAWAYIYPRMELQNLPAGTNYNLCLYASCDSGSGSIGCKAGSPSTSGGLQGCCSKAGGTANENVVLNPNCPGSDDSVTVYARVYRASGSWTCSNYTIRWGDD